MFLEEKADVDLYYSTEVDVLPCDEVHSHEVVRKFDFPKDYEVVSETQHYIWAFNACHDFGGIYRTLVYFEDELEDFELEHIVCLMRLHFNQVIKLKQFA